MGARNKDKKMDNNRNKRSLFWPVVLIGVGIVWMLYNLDLISNVNLSAAIQLWPLLLIGIGMDLLFGRRFPIVSALIGLVVVGGIVGMTPPGIGLLSRAQDGNLCRSGRPGSPRPLGSPVFHRR
jgi:hypothetical protein